MNPNHAAANVLIAQADHLQQVAMSRPGAMAMEVKALAEVLRATPAGPSPATHQLAGVLAIHTTVTYWCGPDGAGGYVWRCRCGATGNTVHNDPDIADSAGRQHVAAELLAALHDQAVVVPAGEKAGT